MASLEPPAKRAKPEESILIGTESIDKYIELIKDTTKNLDPVLNEDYPKEIQLIKVFAGHVRDPKNISKVIQVLNEKIPLKELRHLKRVRKWDIILCPSHYLNGMTTIQEYLDCKVSELNDVFLYFKEIEVPFSPPKLKSQYKEANKIWSCNFHPDNNLERLVSGKAFVDFDLFYHRLFMEIAFDVCKWYMQRNGEVMDCDVFSSRNVTVVVDYKYYSVVAIGYDNRLENPVQHSTMVAIDNVAKTQGGGAWGDQDKKDVHILLGIDKDLMKYLQQKYRKTAFGARPYVNKSDDSEGPYLCTGYNIYVIRETCVMCSMALVHARASKVFYCFDNPQFGALKSKTRLSSVSSLNHHFDVFTGFV